MSISPAIAVQALEGALEVETDLQCELAVLLTREQQLLTQTSLDGLPALQEQKEAVLARLGKQGENLKACIKSLAQACKLPESHRLTLSGISALLNDRDRARLRKAHQALVSISGKVRDQNRINDRLIHGSMSYVTQYLTLLRGLVAQPAGYLANGIMPEQQQRGRILALRG